MPRRDSRKPNRLISEVPKPDTQSRSIFWRFLLTAFEGASAVVRNKVDPSELPQISFEWCLRARQAHRLPPRAAQSYGSLFSHQPLPKIKPLLFIVKIGFVLPKSPAQLGLAPLDRVVPVRFHCSSELPAGTMAEYPISSRNVAGFVAHQPGEFRENPAHALRCTLRILCRHRWHPTKYFGRVFQGWQFQKCNKIQASSFLGGKQSAEEHRTFPMRWHVR
jgi:hypothetical protein